jgi:hypothetical protein
MLLYPYLEATSLHEFIESEGLFRRANSMNDSNVIKSNDAWFNGLNADRRRGMGGVSVYRCPSSLGNQAIIETGDKRGPSTDYVALIAKYQSTTNRVPHWAWWHSFMVNRTENAERHMSNFIGPFRLPTITFHPDRVNTDQYRNGEMDVHDAWCRSIINWQMRDTFAYWTKGTSNQLLFSEKHIPNHSRTPGTNNQVAWNGGYQIVYEGNLAHNPTRVVTAHAELFARSPAESGTSDANRPPQDFEGRYTLGSSHPGSVNVLIGDGAVRTISKSTQPQLMWDLTNAVDGKMVSLP